MPKNEDSLNIELERLLKRFNPIKRSSSFKKTPSTQDASLFQFPLIVDGEKYGVVGVSIDGTHQLIVYFDDSLFDSPKVSKNGDMTWGQLILMLKNFALSKQLSFKTKNEDEAENDMQKREHAKKLDEGYHAMGRKQSYNDAIPECKIIIKHSKVMEEGEQRFRNVERIFIENAQGERFLAPTTKPGIARVYARHIAEGGLPHDDRWKHISTVVEDYTKMAGFVRATKGNQFNESTQKLINEGVQHYLGLRESLHALTTRRGYSNYFESWTPPLMEDEVQEDLTDMFKTSQLDPRIESVMPILNRLSKNLTETTLDEVASLEEWANNIVEGSLIPKTTGQIEQLAKILAKEKFALGPGGSFAKNALTNVLHDDDLFNELEQAGDKNPNGDAREVVIAWMTEQNNPEFKTILNKLQTVEPRPDPTISENDEEQEADYDDDYQNMVMRVGQKARQQEKKNPVDLDKLSKRINKPDEEQLDEILPALASIGGEMAGAAAASELGLGAMGTQLARGAGSAIAQNLVTPDEEEDETTESIDANQKKAGQLGPTEKVSKNNVGKLVGVSESDTLARIKKLSGL